MGLTEFAVNLDTNRHVFYPGEQLTGHVVVHLNNFMEMRGLRIEFQGKCTHQFYFFF